MKRTRNTSIDPAALGAATAGAIIALIVTPGEYGLFSLMFGLSLTLVLVAYEVGKVRSCLQSLAVASALGLSTLPIVSFFFELLWKLKIPEGCTNEGYPNTRDSCVPEEVQFVAWCVITFAWFLVDRYFVWRSRQAHRE
jgi:hypothetical protein